MPFIRSLTSVHYALLAIFISLNSKIISPCSYCAKKKLVCYYAVRYRVPLNTSKWAKYIDKEIIVKPFLLKKPLECVPNNLTFLILRFTIKKRTI